MCTEIVIRRKGLRPLYIETVRDLARHFRVLVPASYGDGRTARKVNRMATYCLCPIDVRESAKRSGYRIVEEPGFCPDFIVEKMDK